MADGNTTNNNRLSGSDAAGAGGDLAASNVADNDDVVRRLAESERARQILYEQATSANKTLNKLAENSRVRNELRNKIDTIVDRQEERGVVGVAGSATSTGANVTSTSGVANVDGVANKNTSQNDATSVAKGDIALPKGRRENRKRLWIILGAVAAVVVIGVVTAVVVINMNSGGTGSCDKQEQVTVEDNTNIASECMVGEQSEAVCGEYKAQLLRTANDSDNEDDRVSAALELTGIYAFDDSKKATQYLTNFYMKNQDLSDINTYYVLSNLLSLYSDSDEDVEQKISILETLLKLPVDMELPYEDWSGVVRPMYGEQLKVYMSIGSEQ